MKNIHLILYFLLFCFVNTNAQIESKNQQKFKCQILSVKFGETAPVVMKGKNFLVLDHQGQSLRIFYANSDKVSYDLMNYKAATFDFEGESNEGFSYTGIDKENFECSLGFFWSKKLSCMVLFVFYNNLEYTTYLCEPTE